MPGMLRPAAAPPSSPPVAEQRPHAIASPHGSRTDEYYWLRDDTRSDPRVLAYLAAENAWREAGLAHLAPLTERLYQEFLGRIRQEDASVPYRKRGHWYYSRFEAGDEYSVHARRVGAIDAPEQVLLDQRERALGHEFYDLGGFDISRDERLLAWTEDTVGRREYTLRFRDLVTGLVLGDTITGVESQVVWTGDHHSVLYIEKDPRTLLGVRVRRHRLGTPQAEDELVYEEHDEAFYTWIDSSKDERFLLIGSTSTLSTELRFARVDDPSLRFQVLLPRERDHEYEAEPFGERWIIRTNRGAPNFRLVEAGFDTVREPAAWRELIAHREDASIAGFDVFDTFLAVEERSGGLRRLRLRDWDGGHDRYIESAEPAFQMALGPNEELDSRVVRYVYASLTTPSSTYDFDLDSGRTTLLKRETVLGDFDPANYVTEYVRAPARDGEQIPIALVYRRGLCSRRNGTTAAVRLRRLRALVRSVFLLAATVAARPRFHFRHRAGARRAGARPTVVRPGAVARKAQQLQRLHRRDALAGQGAVRRCRRASWRPVAARVGCSWAPSPISRRRTTALSSRTCRSSTW